MANSLAIAGCWLRDHERGGGSAHDFEPEQAGAARGAGA
jgi:hypothetical protein